MLKNITVCVDATSFVNKRAPGYNAYLLSLLDGLYKFARSNFNYILCVRSDQAEHFMRYSDRFFIYKVSVRSVFTRLLWQNFFQCFFVKADVYLFTGNFLPLFWRNNSILVVHDLNYIFHPGNFSFLNLIYRKIFIPYSIRSADKVISISCSVAESVSNCFGVDSIVIHNPVNEPSGEEVFSGDDGDIFIIPSSLAVHKNIPQAVEAIKQYVKIFPNSRFIFFGNWSASSFIWKGGCPQIEVMGFVSDCEKNILFKKCNAVVVPSYFEGFGIPYVEALFNKKCLICADIPVAREVVEDYPVYIPRPFGAKEIFDSLISAKKNCFGINRGLADVLKNRYSPVGAAEKYIGVINDVVSE